MKRAIPLLLIATALWAQEPPEPRPREDKQPQEEKQPPRRPAPAPVPAKVQGLADDFGLGEERYLPDYKPAEEHAAPLESRPEGKPPEASSGSSFSFASLFSGDRTFINILLLCAIVGVFVLYRLRGRR